MFGYLFVNYGIFVTDQHKLFEVPYPAHPLILERRTQAVNNICYYYPEILKNEIEYLHSKLHPIIKEGEEKTPEGESSSRYEKDFATKGKDPKRFKVIVEDGKVFLQCIDSFEEIFELSRDLVEEMELTDILDPYIFDNHKDIVNALFETYYDLASEYCQKFYFGSKEF